MNDQRTAQTDNDHRDSREVERDIERTRGAIDRTLDEIGDRLHPQHLLHQAMDAFRSEDGEPSEWAIELRRSGKRIARKIKRNPLPAVLIGAGAAWLWMQDENEQRRREMHRQWDDLPEHSGSFVDARTGEPYEEDYGGKYAAAWHPDYDWSDAHDDEASWSSRAEAAMNELREAVGDTTRSAKERLSQVAGKMASLSGMKRSEIQRALHAQWDDIPSHSGSNVDARTGKPYDESYGEQWRQLAAIDTFHPASHSASSADEGEEEEGWGERVEQALHSIQTSLSDTTGSAKERLHAIGGQLSKLAEGSRSYSAKYGRSGRRKLNALARGTQHRAQRIGRQVGSGYESTRDYMAETIEDNPLVTGVAVLGLGMLVGSLLPSTRLEDDAMGQRSDELKARGAEAGREAVQRGQEVAASAGEAAYDEAKRQGLTPSQLAERAREGVDQLAGAAKENAPSAGDLRSKAEAVVERATEAAKDAAQGETHHQPSGGAGPGTSAPASSLGGTSQVGPSGAFQTGSSLGGTPATFPPPSTVPQPDTKRTPPSNP